MSIPMARDTRDALGPVANACESRSLLQQKLVFNDGWLDSARAFALALTLADPTEWVKRLKRDQQEAQRKLERKQAERPREFTHEDAEKLEAAGAFLEILEARNPLDRSRPRAPLRFSSPDLSWLSSTPSRRRVEIPLFTAERLALGLANSPLENAGLDTHRFFGVPVIAGSVLKGVARDGAKFLVGLDRARIREVFGNEPEEDRKFLGGPVSFLAAYPADLNCALELDVLTPHFQKYYGRAGNSKAEDIEQPVPSVFPVVREDVEFQFHLTCLTSRVSDEEATSLLEDASKSLRRALLEFGLGGKTRAGYGRFRETRNPAPLPAPAHDLFPAAA